MDRAATGAFATCEACGKVMAPGGTCTVPQYDFPAGSNKHWLARIPVGKEERTKLMLAHSPSMAAILKDHKGENCGDCNAAPGQLHHVGCDKEECPSCGQQAIGCECVEAGPKTAEEKAQFFRDFTRYQQDWETGRRPSS